jgi:hypothetical protein
VVIRSSSLGPFLFSASGFGDMRTTFGETTVGDPLSNDDDDLDVDISTNLAPRETFESAELARDSFDDDEKGSGGLISAFVGVSDDARTAFVSDASSEVWKKC